MLTIIAWTIFIPAIFWNFIVFTVVIGDIFERKVDLRNTRNWIDLAISLTFLFVPGVYLFGLW